MRKTIRCSLCGMEYELEIPENLDYQGGELYCQCGKKIIFLEETEIKQSCVFYNPRYCNPCKSPDDYTKCVLVQTGMNKHLDNILNKK